MSYKPERPLTVHGVGNAVIDSHPNGDESPGGSACNFSVGTALFEVPSVLHAAVGMDSDGDMIVDTLERAGVSTAGLYRYWAPTARNTHTFNPSDPDTTVMASSEYHAGQQHTIEDIRLTLGSLVVPGDVVYFAGLARRAIIDHPDAHGDESDKDPYRFEKLLDHLKKDLGVGVAIDPGRPPKTHEPRHHRASTFFRHAQNTIRRTDILALNQEEAHELLGVSPRLLASDALSQSTLDKVLQDEVMGKLVDKESIASDASLLFCLTLGKNGIYLSNLKHSAFIGVPPLAEHERRTTLGLGDSTKAGLFKGLIHETGGAINADTISDLTPEQLRRIAAIGSAASTYRMQFEAYAGLEQLAELVDKRSEHFAPLDVTADYVRSL